jgi:hypothetical protein
VETLARIGRAIDRGLAGIGYGIQAAIVMVIVIVAWPVVEWTIYAGGLIWLVCGVITLPFLVLWGIWKRRGRP